MCQGPNTEVPNEVELTTIERRHFRSDENATALLVLMTEDWFRLARPPRARLHFARQLTDGSASPNPQGLAPPSPTPKG